MTKKSGGMFFEKMARPQDGNFFRDMSGRDDAKFHQKTAQSNGAGGAAKAADNAQTNIAGPAPQAAPAPGANAGNYGAGEGISDKKKKGSDSERLALLLRSAADKDDKKESTDKDEKTASAAPSDWDGADLATGFHRATREQPEPLEAGGERFHDTDGNGSEYRGQGSRTHGVVEGGSMRKRQGTGHQMGKHASASPARFLGTSFNKTAEPDMKYDKDYAKRLGGNVSGTVRKTLSQAGQTAGKALEEGSKSPIAVGIAALLAAKLGMRGIKGAAGLAGLKRKAPAGLIGRSVGAIKKVING